ncbi:SurA N-terminal domain-containing protein [Shouchella shacheensis]|uniref:SurA N-terminal domain-containing protein n=1 Tax=Shouchella shacheensis TaxID=1649580 RepID=UPI00074030CF|nr:SurA N-terminal domain-containing protein [Shouchella shacheensis]
MKLFTQGTIAALLVVSLLGACSNNGEEEESAPEPMFSSTDPEDWPDVVATVNGTDITKESFQQEVEQNRTDYESAASEETDPERNEQLDQLHMEQALNRQIDAMLLNEAALEEGYTVSEEELREALDEIKETQGIESDEEYEHLLYIQGYTKENYEEEVENQLLNFKYIDGTFGEPEITEEDVRAYYEEAASGEDDMPAYEEVKDQLQRNLESEQRFHHANELLETLREEAELDVSIYQ